MSVNVCVLSNIRSMRDVYHAFAQAFDFPSEEGNNLDALYDRLSTDVSGPVEIYWKDHQCAIRVLGKENYENLIALIQEVQASREDVKFILE